MEFMLLLHHSPKSWNCQRSAPPREKRGWAGYCATTGKAAKPTAPRRCELEATVLRQPFISSSLLLFQGMELSSRPGINKRKSRERQ
uniref:Uncharacterized protein n=1 Tax=Leersia perrieri TaxID=77586 RepID=A0A0D9WW09_9ORYZ